MRFECTQCGDCCTVEGDVWFDAQEATAVDAEVDGDWSDALALPGGYRRARRTEAGCHFLTSERACGIHAQRPAQCAAYPFWPRVLRSPATWREEATRCQGIQTNDDAAADVVDAGVVSAEAARWAAWLRRFPVGAAAAIEETERWARLVVELRLCPWAQQSLETPGATRYVCWDGVMSGDDTEEAAARVLVDEAQRLLESAAPDAAAITFVVFPGLFRDDFAAFNAWIEHLEDDVFAAAEVRPSCDEAGARGGRRHPQQHLAGDADEGATTVLADAVQLAGFHPAWQYGGLDPEDGVHFEKRAPHPTVSLVRTAAIRDAQHITARIAVDNERTLRDLDPDDLRCRFAALASMSSEGRDGDGRR